MRRQLPEASYALLYAVTSRITIVAISLLAARFLSVADYGMLSYFLISVSSVAALSSMGVGVTCNTVAARYYRDDPLIVSATFTLSIIVVSCLAIVFSVLFTALSAEALEPVISTANLFFLFFCLSLAMTLYGTVEGVLYGLSRYKTMLMSAFFIMLAAVLFGFGAITTLGLSGGFLAIMAHRIIAASTLVTVVRKTTQIRFSFPALKQRKTYARNAFVLASLPIAIASILAGPVTALAVNMVERSTGMEDVAAFALMYQFYLIAVFIPGALSHFLLSKFSTPKTNEAALLKRSLGITIVYGLVAAVGFMILGWPLAFIAPSIIIDPQLLVFFAASIACYSVTTSFQAFWPSVDRAYMILIAQVVWAGAVISATLVSVNTLGGQAIGFGFMLGSIGQLVVHIIAFYAFRARR